MKPDYEKAVAPKYETRAKEGNGKEVKGEQKPKEKRD